MAQDRRVHALVYFCSAVDNLLGVIFYGGLDMELADMTIQFAADPQAFYGFPNGSVSSSKVGGNDLTDGETSP